MVEAVYIGTLLPLLFLIITIKGENRRLIQFFAWGLTSALIAYYLNNFIMAAFRLSQATLTIQVAPAIEETLKAAAVFIYLLRKKKTGLYEITRTALAIGIGFSILENYYYLSLMTGTAGQARIFFMIIRSLSACLLHGSVTALVGYGIRTFVNYRYFSLLLTPGLLGLAIVLHSLFNLFAGTENLQVVCLLVPGVLFTLEFFFFNFFGRKSTLTYSLPEEGNRK